MREPGNRPEGNLNRFKHQIPHHLAGNAASGGNMADDFTITAVRGEGNSHHLAIPAGDLEPSLRSSSRMCFSTRAPQPQTLPPHHIVWLPCPLRSRVFSSGIASLEQYRTFAQHTRHSCQMSAFPQQLLIFHQDFSACGATGMGSGTAPFWIGSNEGRRPCCCIRGIVKKRREIHEIGYAELTPS